MMSSMTLNDELITAIKQCNITEVETLINRGADVNACNKFTGSPLINALYQKNITLVNLLIEHKADLNKVDRFNVSPLEVAMKLGFWEGVSLLNLQGAKLPESSHSFYSRNRINNFKSTRNFKSLQSEHPVKASDRISLLKKSASAYKHVM